MNPSMHPNMRRSGVLRHVRVVRRIYAFTIVELLVVMAVISLLMSILIPALGRARDHAKLALCKTHLRCIGSGALMYADENQGLLPLDDMLGPGYTGSQGVWVENPHEKLTQALDKYVQDPKAFYCPSETNPTYSYSRGNFEKGTIGYFYFSVKNNPIDNGELSRFLRWEQEGVIQYPRQLTNLMDTTTWVISDMWFSGQPTPHRWFKKGVNYATLDGSVHMVYRSPRKEFR
jgi:prepilin-type N-terminal cleavage/methylation domain-containing protein